MASYIPGGTLTRSLDTLHLPYANASAPHPWYGGDSELAGRATEMGESATGDWKGGGRCADVGNVLHCGCSGGSPLQVGFVVHVIAYWKGAGRISPPNDT